MKTKEAKHFQLKNVIWLIVGLGIILVVLFCFMLHKSSNKILLNSSAHFDSGLTHVPEESIILEMTQKKVTDMEKKTDVLTQAVKSFTESTDTTSNQLKEMQQNYQQLKAQWDQMSLLMQQKNNTVHSASNNPFGVPSSVDNNAIDQHADIREDHLSLTDDSLSPIKNPDTYVPAGTFVKAIMIGGADASAAVNAQANPVPMLFRLVADGTLPNHKTSHLKDCIVTAAVVGDISSERGSIRLENLSCTFPNNEVVDQQVEGTVFGPEGKNGVRGIPVWREGKLLERAFAAGTLSGFSDGLSQTYTSNSISPLGNTQTIDSGKIMQYGFAKGAGKAMDKLADYNIQRAEQYHPVIQLSAGTEVDVVFLKGFFLDGKNKHSEEKIIPPVQLFSNNKELYEKTHIS